MVDAGVSTGFGSGTFDVAVIIKKDNNKNATSHMAVMSILVLFLDVFIFAILLYFNLIIYFMKS
jgi:hypothetical protein